MSKVRKSRTKSGIMGDSDLKRSEGQSNCFEAHGTLHTHATQHSCFSVAQSKSLGTLSTLQLQLRIVWVGVSISSSQHWGPRRREWVATSEVDPNTHCMRLIGLFPLTLFQRLLLMNQYGPDKFALSLCPGGRLCRVVSM